jgi:hypothetical protein
MEETEEGDEEKDWKEDDLYGSEGLAAMGMGALRGSSLGGEDEL